MTLGCVSWVALGSVELTFWANETIDAKQRIAPNPEMRHRLKFAVIRIDRCCDGGVNGYFGSERMMVPQMVAYSAKQIDGSPLRSFQCAGSHWRPRVGVWCGQQANSARRESRRRKSRNRSWYAATHTALGCSDETENNRSEFTKIRSRR